MKEELKNLLAEYLGELMHKHENTFDWIEKEKVIEKINAVNALLDIDSRIGTLLDTMKFVIGKTTLPAPAVSHSINGYEEYVEQIDKLMEDYEGQALSNAIVSEIIEPLKKGTQGYWKALQVKHEDLRQLIEENKKLKAAPAVGGMREKIEKLEWYAWDKKGMIAYKKGVPIEDVFILRQDVLDILKERKK